METKIGPQYQDMFDNLFIEYSKNIVPEMWNLGLTPNNVTTLSLIFGLVSAIMLHNGNYLIFGILHLISYILDTCDGMMARKYNLTSDFGDKYDHFKDWFVGIILLFLFLKKFPISKNVCSYSIGIFLVIISFIHVGCKEKIYKKWRQIIKYAFYNTTFLC